MQSELIAVVGTLSGALLVGVINYFSNRSSKNYEWRLSLARDQVATRQKLYAAFLVEAQRLTIQGREEKISLLSDLNEMNGKFAEICLLASANVIDEARKLADCALTSQGPPSGKEARNFSTLKESFIRAAREDMAQVLRDA